MYQILKDFAGPVPTLGKGGVCGLPNNKRHARQLVENRRALAPVLAPD